MVEQGVLADTATQEFCGKEWTGVDTMDMVNMPDGINLQMLDLISKAGGFQAWVDAMGPVLDRTTENIPKI